MQGFEAMSPPGRLRRPGGTPNRKVNAMATGAAVKRDVKKTAKTAKSEAKGTGKAVKKDAKKAKRKAKAKA